MSDDQRKVLKGARRRNIEENTRRISCLRYRKDGEILTSSFGDPRERGDFERTLGPEDMVFTRWEETIFLRERRSGTDRRRS